MSPLVGVVGHTLIDIPSKAGYGSLGTTATQMLMILDAHGFEFSWASQNVVPPQGNGSATGKSLVLFPGASPLAGTFICGASSRIEYDYAYSLNVTTSHRSLSTLGHCPAQAGAGSISGCWGLKTSSGAPVDCDFDDAHLKGEVAGTPIDANYKSHSASLPRDPNQAVNAIFGNGGLVYLAPSLPGTQGFLVLPSDGPSPGQIICAGKTTLTFGATSGFTFELEQLGVVGTCPGKAVSGQLDDCR